MTNRNVVAVVAIALVAVGGAAALDHHDTGQGNRTNRLPISASNICESFATRERRKGRRAYPNDPKRNSGMLASLAAGSPVTIAILVGCFILVLFFEFSNGFHDTANAVATVIYTNSLRPAAAVIWSGILNFVGVIVGGIAVAYALVELIPPDVLSPPDGNLAAGMLVAVFVAALLWNVGTWWFGIPNSSSHALIGALIGVAIEHAFAHGGSGARGVDWAQVWGVLGSLLVSPLLGFALAFCVFLLFKHFIHQKQLFEPPDGDKPPVWWMRALLILTCTGVSFAHGTNDGQKSIGLIMLTIIGLMPATMRSILK